VHAPSVAPPGADQAAALWEHERRKIEAARHNAPKQASAAELAWQEQERRIHAAREARLREIASHQPPKAAASPARTSPKPSRSPQREDAEFDAVVAIIQEAQQLTSEHGPQFTLGEDEADREDEAFSEAPLPQNDVSRLANAVKFTLDGKTLQLKGATAGDALTNRVEALRVFLTEALGGDDAFNALHATLEHIQNCDADDDEADRMLEDLERAYGPKAKYVDLMVQYMVCVNMLGA
jgi:hypothetical protein